MNKTFRLEIANGIAKLIDQSNWYITVESFLDLVYIEARHSSGTKFTVGCLATKEFWLGHAYTVISYADPELVSRVLEHAKKVLK